MSVPTPSPSNPKLKKKKAAVRVIDIDDLEEISELDAKKRMNMLEDSASSSSSLMANGNPPEKKEIQKTKTTHPPKGKEKEKVKNKEKEKIQIQISTSSTTLPNPSTSTPSSIASSSSSTSTSTPSPSFLSSTQTLISPTSISSSPSISSSSPLLSSSSPSATAISSSSPPSASASLSPYPSPSIISPITTIDIAPSASPLSSLPIAQTSDLSPLNVQNESSLPVISNKSLETIPALLSSTFPIQSSSTTALPLPSSSLPSVSRSFVSESPITLPIPTAIGQSTSPSPTPPSSSLSAASSITNISVSPMNSNIPLEHKIETFNDNEKNNHKNNDIISAHEATLKYIDASLPLPLSSSSISHVEQKIEIPDALLPSLSPSISTSPPSTLSDSIDNSFVSSMISHVIDAAIDTHQRTPQKEEPIVLPFVQNNHKSSSPDNEKHEIPTTSSSLPLPLLPQISPFVLVDPSMISPHDVSVSSPPPSSSLLIANETQSELSSSTSPSSLLSSSTTASSSSSPSIAQTISVSSESNILPIASVTPNDFPHSNPPTLSNSSSPSSDSLPYPLSTPSRSHAKSTLVAPTPSAFPLSPDDVEAPLHERVMTPQKDLNNYANVKLNFDEEENGGEKVKGIDKEKEMDKGEGKQEVILPMPKNEESKESKESKESSSSSSFTPSHVSSYFNDFSTTIFLGSHTENFPEYFDLNGRNVKEIEKEKMKNPKEKPNPQEKSIGEEEESDNNNNNNNPIKPLLLDMAFFNPTASVSSSSSSSPSSSSPPSLLSPSKRGPSSRARPSPIKTSSNSSSSSSSSSTNNNNNTKIAKNAPSASLPHSNIPLVDDVFVKSAIGPGASITLILRPLPRIPKLDVLLTQAYRCYSCNIKLKLHSDLFSSSCRYCHYTGKYHCLDCHHKEERIIPGRLLEYGDVKKYKVSDMANSYLSSMTSIPLISVIAINPQLFAKSKSLRIVFYLRQQLSLMRGFILTCKQRYYLLRLFGSRKYFIYDTTIRWGKSNNIHSLPIQTSPSKNKNIDNPINNNSSHVHGVLSSDEIMSQCNNLQIIQMVKEKETKKMEEKLSEREAKYSGSLTPNTNKSSSSVTTNNINNSLKKRSHSSDMNGGGSLYTLPSSRPHNVFYFSSKSPLDNYQLQQMINLQSQNANHQNLPTNPPPPSSNSNSLLDDLDEEDLNPTLSDMYSLDDLIDILDGDFADRLSLLVKNLQLHIMNGKCTSCHSKGFYCQYAKCQYNTASSGNAQSIPFYSFQFSSVIQCSQCGIFHHRVCYQHYEEKCPKCERMKKKTKEKDRSQLQGQQHVSNNINMGMAMAMGIPTSSNSSHNPSITPNLNINLSSSPSTPSYNSSINNFNQILLMRTKASTPTSAATTNTSNAYNFNSNSNSNSTSPSVSTAVSPSPSPMDSPSIVNKFGKYGGTSAPSSHFVPNVPSYPVGMNGTLNGSGNVPVSINSSSRAGEREKGGAREKAKEREREREKLIKKN